jgi:hypothetical protein
VGCSTSTTRVGCSTSTSTTAGGTAVCFAACLLGVVGTGAHRDRRRRVGTGVLMFYILFSLLLLCKLCFYVEKNAKSKNMRDANGRVVDFDHLDRSKAGTRADILNVRNASSYRNTLRKTTREGCAFVLRWLLRPNR